LRLKIETTMQIDELIEKLRPASSAVTNSSSSGPSETSLNKASEFEDQNREANINRSQNLIAKSFIEQEMNNSPRPSFRNRPLHSHQNPQSLREQDALINAVRSRAKVAVIEQKRRSLADDNAFFALAKLFTDAKLVTMDFKLFKEQAQIAPESVRRFFTASNFMLFPRNARGCIACDEFLRYVGVHNCNYVV
jgi:hypothetical protein